MLRKQLREAGVAPAAEALRLLILCGAGLPPAGAGLSHVENAFVWLARLLVDTAFHPADADVRPQALRERLHDTLSGLFGPHAHDIFPLLLSRRAPSARDAGDGLAAAGASVHTSGAAAPEFDALGHLFEAHLERNRDASRGQHYTPRPVAQLLVDRLRRWGATGSVYDPAMGTGRFLVPYLAALRAEGALAPDLVRAVAGSEVCRASHCLAQANLLLQVAASPGLGPRLPAPRLLLENSLWGLGHGSPPRFDACCMNPPYLGERGNKHVFDRLADELPAMRASAQPRRDLAYAFIEMALEMTRPGGLIGLLTTSYWLTADGAAALRQQVASRADLLELVDFGDQRLFASAPGLHSLVVVMRRRLPEESADAGDPPTAWARVLKPGPLEQVCERVGHMLDTARESASPARDGVVESGVGQMARTAGPRGPWHIPVGRRSEEVLARIAEIGVPLASIATVNQGLVSGADRVSSVNVHRMPEGSELDVGSGIFVLEPDELRAAGIPLDCPIVKPFCKNSEIERYALPREAPRRYVLYLDGSLPVDRFPAVRRHLERWRPILEGRREVASGTIPWWRLHWPRREAIFTDARIICPHRAMANTFAYVDTPLYASADVYVIRAHGREDSLHLLTGVLNSPVLDFWFAHRGKRKGALREYYATPLKACPVPAPEPRSVADAVQLTEVAPIDESLPERVAWYAERGDLPVADRAIARVTAALVRLRSHSEVLDLREIALAVMEERRLAAVLDSLVALRYGLHGPLAWMHDLILEWSAER